LTRSTNRSMQKVWGENSSVPTRRV
jgi:hypothetical protein